MIVRREEVVRDDGAVLCFDDGAQIGGGER